MEKTQQTKKKSINQNLGTLSGLEPSVLFLKTEARFQGCSTKEFWKEK